MNTEERFKQLMEHQRELFNKVPLIVKLAIGLITFNDQITISGTILFGHSSFDRIMGYGLKYFDGFKHTHLGWMK